MIRRLDLIVGSMALALACGPTDSGSESEEAGASTDVHAVRGKKPPPIDDPLSGLPECAGGVMAAFSLEAMKPTLRGSEAYRVPTATELLALESSIRSLLSGDVKGASGWATSAEYALCRGTGSESALALWKPPSGEGQAQIVVRTGAARQAIFEAPHPLYDAGTLDEASYLFTRLGARALIASGTHRCANSAASGCSGSTTACDTTEAPFRISDMAHTEQSAFHTAHRALAEHFAQDWVFAIHGSSSPGVSVSDGTTFPTDGSSPSAQVASALASRLSGVTTCNAFHGVAYDNHLCGTTDVQGRHLNGSDLICSAAATASSKRFIHLEQSREVRSTPVLVGDALDAVVPR